MSSPRSAIVPALVLGLAASWVSTASAQPQAPARLERAPEEVANAVTTGRPGRPIPEDIPANRVIKVSARLVGTPSHGLKVTLDGSATTGGRVWFRWLQTQGPKVIIDDSTKPEAHFTVPTDARRLEFVLVAGDATGVDAKSLTVDVDDPERDSDEAAMKADAGDDQAAKVGRRVVLNGTRSAPSGKLRYRWVQSGGPKVTLKAGDGPTTSFVPSTPGTYQFALIVGLAGGALSEPSTVTVTVLGNARASADPGEAPTMAIDELARSSVASIEGGPKYAEDLSKVFDKVADQVDSFKTYLEAATEMTRRLDLVIPREKDRRAVWIDRFFAPLMVQIGGGMKLEGLDITRPEAQRNPLTKPQKARLAEQFRFTAAGLRATKTMR